MIHPHFIPDIDLGHLVQAAVVAVTVGGGVLGGYISLRNDLDMQRTTVQVALAGHATRLAMLEHQFDERRAEQRQFHAEMRAALGRIMLALGDLHTELVQKEDRKWR